MRALIALAALLCLTVASARAAPPLSKLRCKPGDDYFSALPTNLASVAGIVPLGNMNPAGHTIPTRHFYIYPTMTTPGDPATSITVPVFAPGKVEIVAAVFHPAAPDWDLFMMPCAGISAYYFHVDKLSPAVAAAVGDIASASITLTDGSKAKPISFVVGAGDLVGYAQTFDIGLQDFRKAPQPFANPARYKVDLPALFAAFPGFAGDPIAEAVVPRIIPQALYNRCAIDYFKPAQRALLTAKLSDYDGAPLASGTPKCHSHMQDVPGSAQGNWWDDTDPLHDALFREEYALALAPWNVDPAVQLFSVNENVPGWSSALIEGAPPPSAANTLLEFPVREGPQRTNRRFKEITDDAIYCYDLVRNHRGGPRVNAVILLQVSDGPTGARGKLKIEFVKASRCPALPVPWSFSAAAATYHR